MFQRMTVIIYNIAKFLRFIAYYKIRYIKIQTVDTLHTKGNFCLDLLHALRQKLLLLKK